MSDLWTDRLSEYLDDSLSPHERVACARHIGSCADCRETVAALGAVKERAGALMDPPMPNDLWAGIASRIGSAGSTGAPLAPVLALPRRRSFARWAPLAAAAAAVLVTAGAFWFALDARHAFPTAGNTPAAGGTRLATFDAARADGEIAGLQLALDRGRGKLDPKTVQVLEKNLALIREATEDARRALAKDPANRELQDYFAATVQSKIDLMRRATAMAGV